MLKGLKMKQLFLLPLALILVVLLIGCTPTDYSSCNTLLHEGKVRWTTTTGGTLGSVTFEDGTAYVGENLGVMDYDGSIYDWSRCSAGGCNGSILSGHIYTDIDYKL